MKSTFVSGRRDASRSASALPLSSPFAAGRRLESIDPCCALEGPATASQASSSSAYPRADPRLTSRGGRGVAASIADGDRGDDFAGRRDAELVLHVSVVEGGDCASDRARREAATAAARADDETVGPCRVRRAPPRPRAPRVVYTRCQSRFVGSARPASRRPRGPAQARAEPEQHRSQDHRVRAEDDDEERRRGAG